jgi:hypothetical protein
MARKDRQMIIRSISTTNTADLAGWCREYHFNNPWPADFSKRFSIGLYQIWGGICWLDSKLVVDKINPAESFCAGALHFLMVCEALELDWCLYLPNNLNEIDRGTARYGNERDYKELVIRISRAQQMITPARLRASEEPSKQGGPPATSRSY